jgi:4-aminobutyrate aminotransferase
MSLSGSKLVHRRGFSPLVPDIHHLPYPRIADCGLRIADLGAEPAGCSDSGCRMIREMEETLMKRIAPPEEVAAIFIEPIQGEGGYRVCPPGCLPALRRLCDRHGILLVVDEVQSGMGRTGKMYAIEHWGIEADIVCTAKGIASGMPLGAIIARDTVMDWPPGSHASTFGGNPVSCRAAMTTLELLEREYMANARERGEQLRAGLRAASQRHPALTDSRGLGLMTAVDIVRDDQSPDAKKRDFVIQRSFEAGLLLLGCGENGIRFCPPLCVTAAQVDSCLQILQRVLAAL